MAQYFVDINAMSSGSSTGWTRYINSSGTIARSSGTPATFDLVSSAAGTKVFGYDVLNGINDNLEVLVKFKLSSATGKQGIAAFRYSGSSEATTKGYTLSGSVISSVGTLAIDEGSTGYVAWTNWNYLANIWYWARFRINGTELRAKVWNDGSAEPGSWMIDTTNSVTSTGSFNGLHDYNTGTVNYGLVSFATNGDTALSYMTTNNAIQGKFKVNVPPTTSNVSELVDGGYGVQVAGSQSAGGNTHQTGTIQDKDQSGKFSVYKLNTKPQTGKFRTYKITQQSQHGQFRIYKNTTEIQSGIFRVTNTPNRAQQGKFRVYKVTSQSQTGRFETSELEHKLQQGIFRVGKTSQNVQSGVFRVQSTILHPQTGKFSIYKVLENEIQGIFRVAKSVSHDITGKFNILLAFNKDQGGKFFVYNPTLNAGNYEPKRNPDGQYNEGDEIDTGIYEKKQKPDGQFSPVDQVDSGFYEKKKINEGRF